MRPLNAKRSAAAGLIAWLLLLLATTADSASIELIHKVVLLGVLVVVPLALSLVIPPDCSVSFLIYNVALALWSGGAALTIISFFFDQDVLAAVLVSLTFSAYVAIALYGVSRLISRRSLFPLAESSIDAGLIYLPVAGAWLVVYRLGVQPFDYGEIIILLTVVHFHFAGFAAPIIAGMNGRVLASRDYPRWLFAFSVFAIVAAMPIVAAGITLNPLLGLIGTLLLTLGLVSLAVLTIGWVRPAIDQRWKQVLLVLAALSSCLAMSLASLYSYSLVTHTLILTIPQMAVTHGILNAFGFVTCSLIAWSGFRLKDLLGHKETQIP
jgi:hypothetical protein